MRRAVRPDGGRGRADARGRASAWATRWNRLKSRRPVESSKRTATSPRDRSMPRIATARLGQTPQAVTLESASFAATCFGACSRPSRIERPGGLGCRAPGRQRACATWTAIAGHADQRLRSPISLTVRFCASFRRRPRSPLEAPQSSRHIRLALIPDQLRAFRSATAEPPPRDPPARRTPRAWPGPPPAAG